jgi:hypothetical protein
MSAFMGVLSPTVEVHGPNESDATGATPSGTEHAKGSAF